MEYFIAVLAMLLLIGISNVLNRLIPFVPVPLFQIALGIVVALVGIKIDLDPELFLVLFIAPLLYNDARQTPRNELWNLRGPIVLLAFGLVFITVLVAGYAIHYLIPSIPLPAAFALAAILSPTDAVAVGSLAKRIHLPGSIHRLLEGESLLNDASGLVAFKFAVAAMVTGTFSLWQASFNFVLVALGGLAVGTLMSFVLIRCQVLVRKWGMEDITVHVLWQILTPFVIYLVAEEIGVSGILAVVAGGIIYAMEKDRAESVQLKMQIVSTSTWSVIVYILNGLVFMMLGSQIPEVMGSIFSDPAFNNGIVLGYVALITLLLYILRFVWIYLYWSVRYMMSRQMEDDKPDLHGILLTSLSGVRGALTLAAAFSIPYVLNDGSAFPQRELILFIAAGVILLSLILASILLPILSSRPQPAESGAAVAVGQPPTMRDMDDHVRMKVLQAAIQSVESSTTETNREVAQGLITDITQYMFRKNMLKQHIMNDPDLNPQEIELYLAGIQAERKVARRMRDSGEITPELAMEFEYRLDRIQTVLSNRVDTGIAECVDKWKGMLPMHIPAPLPLSEQTHSDETDPQQAVDKIRMLKQLKLQACPAAIESIRSRIDDQNEEAANKVIAKYRKVMESIRYYTEKMVPDVTLNEGKLNLITTAVQNQRDAVQELYESGEIDRQHARKMRSFVQDLEKWILMES
ncbi:Na+/H+ antiporter [Paenibacillus wulumuqiensis]|uniref:Na+/H+ antiporter n=1 Tax=Paenibacillus wulumuqiensis TaxID=1567107 RepID=UPI0006196079|nr:Na+/H+ antiporter [Paenibacillus wulumuqiensis]